MNATQTNDIGRLAQALAGLADVSSPEVAALACGLGQHAPGLATCNGLGDLAATMSRRMPDFVLVGNGFDAAAFQTLRASVRTESLGVVMVTQGGAPIRLPEIAPERPRLELDVVTAGDDLLGVVLQIRGLIRRRRPLSLAARTAVGRLVLDTGAMTLSARDTSAAITLEDARLLGPMFDLPARIWPREDLLKVVYGATTGNALRTIDVKLNQTRRKLKAAFGMDPISAVRGAGYRLNAEP